MRETQASMTNPYLYTETFGEETKTIEQRPPEVLVGESCGGGQNESSLFLFDESTIADIDCDRTALNDTKLSIKSKDEKEEESQQSGESKTEADAGNAKAKHEVIKEDDSCFDF